MARLGRFARLRRANALVIFPAGERRYQAGEAVDVLPL